jgi:hypothetical protein
LSRRFYVWGEAWLSLEVLGRIIVESGSGIVGLGDMVEPGVWWLGGGGGRAQGRVGGLGDMIEPGVWWLRVGSIVDSDSREV